LQNADIREKAMRDAYCNDVRRMHHEILKRAKVLCSTTSSAGAPTVTNNIRFDAIVVDEACFDQEIHVLQVFAYQNPKLAVFVGDPEQLEPISRSGNGKDNDQVDETV
jgi:superfamily I DNA and/or RNA helicase